ncbi:MAG: hypothetical protein QG657_5110, partial [Acidobacteriota bacterium]|nr:hypothetical protein [Acidobacteriota bacterium]
MIIMPQIKELQRGDLRDAVGDGNTVLEPGVYRNISGIFAKVEANNTEVICVNMFGEIATGVANVLPPAVSYMTGVTIIQTLKMYNIPAMPQLNAGNGEPGEGGGGGGGNWGGGGSAGGDGNKGVDGSRGGGDGGGGGGGGVNGESGIAGTPVKNG